MIFLLDGHFEPLKWSAREFFLALLSTLFLLGAFELPTKKLVLERGVARKRDWFITRERQLPARVMVLRDFNDRVSIVDADGGKTVVTLTREFGAPDHIEELLSDELRRIGRLATVG
jgi:hypothetical protein